MTKAEYERYRRTAVWQGKRQLALEAAGGACQLCNRTKKLHVHHRTYERIGGDELVGDLTVLCEGCHNHFHRGRTVYTPRKAKKAVSTTTAEITRNASSEDWWRWRLLFAELIPGSSKMGVSTGAFRNKVSAEEGEVLSNPDATRVLKALQAQGHIEQTSKKRWRSIDLPLAEDMELVRLLEAPDAPGLSSGRK